jgi:Holliday junction resolvase-like predicted endonuclease
MKESKIEREIRDYLLSLNAYILKGNANKTIGVPDIIASINGYFVAIEVKKPTEKPRLNQLKQINKIKKSNGIAFYATSVQDVENHLIKADII